MTCPDWSCVEDCVGLNQYGIQIRCLVNYVCFAPGPHRYGELAG